MDAVTIELNRRGKELGLEGYEMLYVIGIIKSISEMSPKQLQFFSIAMEMFKKQSQ